MIVSSAGDIGDCVFLLAILKELEGGPHTLLLEPSNATKANGPSGVERLYNAVGPLASVQPYISECRIINGDEHVDWASAAFRAKFFRLGNTLMLAHLNNLIEVKGIGSHLINVVGNHKWLKVEPSLESKGRVIINRTIRYRNTSFDWSKVVLHYRHRIMFVGSEHEWRDFIAECGYVDYRPTSNMLEVAQLIAGSELFIGNQSSPNAIAEGLKHRSIQETSLRVPDCIYHRANGQYVTTGAFHLPNVDGSGELDVAAPKAPPLSYNTQKSPPLGWIFRGRFMGNGFMGAMNRMMMQDEFKGVERSIIEGILIEDNVERSPDFFREQHPDLAHMANIAAQAAQQRVQSQPS